MNSISHLFNSCNEYYGYVAKEMGESKIIAYSIIKIGYLEHDRARLQSYGLNPDATTDCTFAPSVADDWQSLGIGNELLQFIVPEIKRKGVTRIILWGGVQSDNERAVKYYLRNGFQIIGQFLHNGENYDMAREI